MSNPAIPRLGLILGVTSVSALVGVLIYYYYARGAGEKKDEAASKRKKRLSSGERTRVTFSDKNEIIAPAPFAPTPSPVLHDMQPLTANAAAQKDELEDEGLCLDLDIVGKDGVVGSEAREPKLERSDKDSKMGNEKMAAGDKSLVLADGDRNGVHGVEEVKKLNGEPEVAASASLSSKTTSAPVPYGITPETDYDRTGITRELRISREYIPGLIGKKGINIRGIQSSSNTCITFENESMENGDRICVIRGQPEAVTVAEAMIEKYILEQPIVLTETLHVPNSCVGRIIGKGGENIRGIQELSRAKVNVDTSHPFRGAAGDSRMVTVTIRGTEEQIRNAKEMIIEKVEEEKALRQNIDFISQIRGPRTGNAGSSARSNDNSNSPGTMSMAANNLNGNNLPLPSSAVRTGVLDVFVSCAYHPNDFWIQVKGHDSVELDKLTTEMTEFYAQFYKQETSWSVGEIVAAPFDCDRKMYRAKILSLEEGVAEVSYVDYGDKRTIESTLLRKIQPEYLRLRFQGIPATLNLSCPSGDHWSDDAISKLCDLTYCAQWKAVTAKIKDYLKGSSDSKETLLWVELVDINRSVGEELIKLGLALPNDSPPLPFSAPSTNAAPASDPNRKSYASVVLEENGSTHERWEGPEKVNGNQH